jgi:hypothetical protein
MYIDMAVGTQIRFHYFDTNVHCAFSMVFFTKYRRYIKPED